VVKIYDNMEQLCGIYSNINFVFKEKKKSDQSVPSQIIRFLVSVQEAVNLQVLSKINFR